METVRAENGENIKDSLTAGSRKLYHFKKK